jgi:hypothetical protein
MLHFLGAYFRAAWISGAGLMTFVMLSGVGCAKSPESIAPAYVSTVNFQSWSCNQLAEEGRRLNQALAEASTQQRNARTNDTIGVIFLGLPVSSLSGDNIAPQIANLKGQMVAVQQAGSSKNCGFRVETANAQ